MKNLTFAQRTEAYRTVNLEIKDEELFRQKCKEWVEQGQTLNYWDFEESFFEDSVQVVYSEWEHSEFFEEDDEFYELMEEENISVEPED